MPSYSADQLYKDWVYAIDQDFRAPDGTPASWASGQPQHYGEEVARISVEADSVSVNADESLIAVSVGYDVHIYSTSLQQSTPTQVLKGHVSRVDALAFHPKDPGILVSCAMNRMGGSTSAPPCIIFWNLDEQLQRDLLTEDQSLELGHHAAGSVAERLSTGAFSWTMTEHDTNSLGKAFSEAVSAENVESQVARNFKLHGRLCGSFGSHIFNFTGTSLAFLPGDKPRTNRDDKWDVCIFDTETSTVRLTLVGHRDALMWTGFSPDDRLIATVSWDQTVRIWSHATGELLHTFRSERQNWTGGFSPDSRFFAATSGDGRFWVWDLSCGIELVSQSFPGGRWCRTLDWSNDGKYLVVGGEKMARVVVYDIKRQTIVQERILSVEKVEENVRWAVEGMLKVSFVRYIQDVERFGSKIVYRSAGDNAVEIYDFDENRKWRYAPREKVDKGFGGNAAILEKRGLIVSVDEDAVRFWPLPTRESGL